MWTSWYALSMWKLWAQSSNETILSQLQTTMTAESHWQHLKHTHLGFMHRPRLNKTVCIMINDIIPAESIKASNLDGTCFTGQPPPLTAFQLQAKKAWIELAQHPCSENEYKPDIQRWTCRCSGQQLQSHHFCKHLVRAVKAASPQPLNFFKTLT